MRTVKESHTGSFRLVIFCIKTHFLQNNFQPLINAPVCPIPFSLSSNGLPEANSKHIFKKLWLFWSVKEESAARTEERQMKPRSVQLVKRVTAWPFSCINSLPADRTGVMPLKPGHNAFAMEYVMTVQLGHSLRLQKGFQHTLLQKNQPLLITRAGQPAVDPQGLEKLRWDSKVLDNGSIVEALLLRIWSRSSQFFDLWARY